jgi:hypothetical protein
MQQLKTIGRTAGTDPAVWPGIKPGHVFIGDAPNLSVRGLLRGSLTDR